MDNQKSLPLKYVWTNTYRSTASYNLKPVTRSILDALANFAQKNDAFSFPSINSVSKRSGWSRSTVREHLKIAEEAGFIRIVHRKVLVASGVNKDTSNLYQFQFPTNPQPATSSRTRKNPLTRILDFFSSDREISPEFEEQIRSIFGLDQDEVRALYRIFQKQSYADFKQKYIDIPLRTDEKIEIMERGARIAPPQESAMRQGEGCNAPPNILSNTCKELLLSGEKEQQQLLKEKQQKTQQERFIVFKDFSISSLESITLRKKHGEAKFEKGLSDLRYKLERGERTVNRFSIYKNLDLFCECAIGCVGAAFKQQETEDVIKISEVFIEDFLKKMSSKIEKFELERIVADFRIDLKKGRFIRIPFLDSTQKILFSNPVSLNDREKLVEALQRNSQQTEKNCTAYKNKLLSNSSRNEMLDLSIGRYVAKLSLEINRRDLESSIAAILKSSSALGKFEIPYVEDECIKHFAPISYNNPLEIEQVIQLSLDSFGLSKPKRSLFAA